MEDGRFRTTKTRRRASSATVFRFIITVLASCVASGPIQSWPTLVPVLEDYGVFGNSSSRFNVTEEEQEISLKTVFEVASAIAIMASYPAGVIFDAYGARLCGALGSIVAAVGLAGTAFSILKADRYSWILYISYPLATIGSYIVPYACFGFLWKEPFPNYQNTLVGITTASTAASDSLILIGIALYKNGFAFPTFCYILAGASLAALLPFALAVPSHETFLQDAAQVKKQALQIQEDEQQQQHRPQQGQREEREASGGAEEVAAPQIRGFQALMTEAGQTFYANLSLNLHFMIGLVVLYVQLMLTLTTMYYFYEANNWDARSLRSRYDGRFKLNRTTKPLAHVG